jgi:hypothetical protein
MKLNDADNVEDFFVNILVSNDNNQPLVKGEIQFLIDIARYTPFEEWGCKVFDEFEEGKYN